MQRDAMSVEQHKATARRLVEEGFGRGNLAVFDQYLAADFVDHAAPPGLSGKGPEYVKQLVTMLRTAFPDWRSDIDDEIGEEDRVVQRGTVSGTHQGDFLGIPATGKQATWSEIHILRFRDEQVVEHWAVLDLFAALQQLGVIPAPAPAGA
jgi:steroid delta-isomerase-like uncharacterized protein